MEKKIILNIAPFDCAGIMEKFKCGFDKYSKDYEWRNIIFNSTHLKYHHDILITTLKIQEVKDIIKKADIIILHTFISGGEEIKHLMNDWDNLYYKGVNLSQEIKRLKKKVIWFLNGSRNLRFWSNHYKDNELANKTLMCSTPDLKELFPKAFYSPAFVDLNNNLLTPLPFNKRSKRLRVTHCPTDANIKNTREFFELMHMLIREYNIDFLPIIQTNNKTTLAVKRASHINLDHLQGYYGVNSLESSAQGVLNLVKLDAYNKKLFCNVAEIDTTPFIECENIYDVQKKLIEFITNKEKLIASNNYARQWMVDYWHPKKHVKRMEKFLGEQYE